MDFSTHIKFHSELFFYILIWQLDCNLAAQLCLDRLHDDFIYQKLNIPLFVYKTKPTISTYFRLLEMTYIIEFLLWFLTLVINGIFFIFSGPSNFSPEYKRRLCQCFEKLLGNPQMRKYFICYFSHWSISTSKGMYV